ncbi:MAG: cysteine--tRNA ligase [Rhodospirillaceae bacterium]|nr:cysteine--tRNA ligase [Rhodospirillaceae bacterium]
MTLRLYNTLSRQKEELRPLDPANVRLYVCGPTVYDRIHIGNARPIVVFDVLFRLLRHEYGAGHVKYARNITDIDDKINNRARDRGVPIGTLTAETTRWFHQDLAELGCLPPTVEPTATGHVAEMIAMIETLIARGYAYPADGHVLFDVPAMNQRPPIPGHVYGLLSRKNRDDLIAGARIDVAPYKKDAADFVLWKPSPPEIPGWDSPWGRGRPGWHIECSAMAGKHLGESFDIHGGGLDLIFPHHENEIAQSECCSGKPFVGIWMHNGFIERGGEKMAKSVGNIDRLRDLLDEFPGEAVRLMLLKTHYRSPLEFTKEGLREAKATLDRWYRSIAQGLDAATQEERQIEENASSIHSSFLDTLRDDLNSAEAIAHLHMLATQCQQAAQQNRRQELVMDAFELKKSAEFLGVLQMDARDWFRWQPKSAAAMDETVIAAQIEARLAARKAKNFKEADRIRDDLAAQGVVLEDGPQGTTWRRAG